MPNKNNFYTKFSHKTSAILAFSFLALQSLHAYGSNNDFRYESSLSPRILLRGTTGTTTWGEADAMLPLMGSSDRFFYSNLMGKFGNDRAWVGSVGLGGRKIFNENIVSSN